MSTTKHTPGPWTATPRHVTAPETEDRLPMRVTISGGNRDDNKANARLIAAAPDLLAALRDLLPDAIGNHIGGPDTQARIDAARAAIIKATEGK